MNQTLAFIGGGNMASSLIGGLLARGWRPDQIVVADPLPAQLEKLKADYGVRTTSDNTDAARGAEVIVLAVKPQELRAAVARLAAAPLTPDMLLISVVAGIRAADIQRWAGGRPVVRCMPNRPALQGRGMTGLYATAEVPAGRRELAQEILSAVGATLWIQREQDMDAVTAISGSGPAYFFLLIEMLQQAGVSLGLASDVSRKLAVETAYGAGFMAHEASEPPEVLRQQVTSKGGTTEAALMALEAHRVREIFTEALTAAARRSAQLADEFGAG
jgi:pyrroline-5-carboxylate reductase